MYLQRLFKRFDIFVAFSEEKVFDISLKNCKRNLQMYKLLSTDEGTSEILKRFKIEKA